MKRIKKHIIRTPSQTRVGNTREGVEIVARQQALRNELKRRKEKERERNRSTDHRLLIKKLGMATFLFVAARNTALPFARQPARKKPFTFSLSTPRHLIAHSFATLSSSSHTTLVQQPMRVTNVSFFLLNFLCGSFSFLSRVHVETEGAKIQGSNVWYVILFTASIQLGKKGEEKRIPFSVTGGSSLKENLLNRLLQ